jgi:hypothetical protein
LAKTIYFLKADPLPDDPFGARAVPFAFAEVVRPGEGRLQAENIQIPICTWTCHGLEIAGTRLRDRQFTGNAYRMPAPGWFKFRNVGDSSPAPEAGAALALERALHTTPLGALCRRPEVRLALAQDRLALALGPMLAVPNLLVCEDRLLRDWDVERPEAASSARASAEALAAANAGLPQGVLDLRLCIHRAALRRLDAAAVGREVFLPCPAYFGEPHIAFSLAGALTFKAGIVRMANSWPRPDTEARSLAWRSDPNMVRQVEARLCPLVSPQCQTTSELAEALQAWQALEPMRAFEASSPLPLFPHATIYPHGYLPRGFRLRIGPETVKACGGSYVTLAAAGLSPYIAEPFDDYCRKHRDLLDAWALDLTGLAASKWGPIESRTAVPPVTAPPPLQPQPTTP